MGPNKDWWPGGSKRRGAVMELWHLDLMGDDKILLD